MCPIQGFCFVCFFELLKIALVCQGWEWHERSDPPAAGNKRVSSVENFKIKPTKNRSPFYHHHVPAILTNVSNKVLLSEKALIELGSTLLWLLMSFPTIQASNEHMCITCPLENTVIYMEVHLENSQLYNRPLT